MIQSLHVLRARSEGSEELVQLRLNHESTGKEALFPSLARLLEEFLDER
jgi:hypothetical protein